MPLTQSAPTQLLKPKLEIFGYDQKFSLEGGDSLPELEIAYTTHGTLSPEGDNVVWVFHALTANADPFEWWPGLIGENDFINPTDHFIVCANMLGSCYGTTGPDHINPETGQKYGLSFPMITVRDMVNAHKLLQERLGIEKIHLGIGGSMGGQQLLEWAVQDQRLFKNITLIATNARHSAWGIAFNESQRLALEADPTFQYTYDGAGEKGLKAARAVAMLSYRNQATYEKAQTDFEDKLDNFKASSYQAYQGEKLVKRFSPHAYWYLSKAMDSHNVGRERGPLEEVLGTIKANTLVIGIETDILFEPGEQEFLTKHIINATFQVVPSLYGHDGFLIETETIGKHIDQALSKLSNE
ncbi:MAG: homoserine O-acetyltransferase [Bacteroidota bacterium]